MTVYADVLFAVHFIMNGVVPRAAAKRTRRRVKNGGRRWGRLDSYTWAKAMSALGTGGHRPQPSRSRLQAPMIIAEFERIKPFLPDGLKSPFYENGGNDRTRLLKTPTAADFAGRLRMVPFNRPGRANGRRIGFKPDRVAVGGAAPVPRRRFPSTSRGNNFRPSIIL